MAATEYAGDSPRAGDETKFYPHGFWDFVARDARGNVLWEEHIPNGIVNGALNDILSVYFAAGTQKTTWYAGLINNSGFSALSSSDTISSHTGWSESSDYSESVRQTWTPGAVASGIITNPSAMVFTANATVTIKGAFLVSNSTKGGTTGQLWATGAFSATQSLSSGQTLSVSYSLTATAS
jgi:hypothetical protein